MEYLILITIILFIIPIFPLLTNIVQGRVKLNFLAIAINYRHEALSLYLALLFKLAILPYILLSLILALLAIFTIAALAGLISDIIKGKILTDEGWLYIFLVSLILTMITAFIFSLLKEREKKYLAYFRDLRDRWLNRD